MKLIEKIKQSRRDFQGEYECQGCGNVETDSGYESYDDDYFHDFVIPAKTCSKCSESTNSLKLGNDRVATKYPEGLQV